MTKQEILDRLYRCERVEILMAKIPEEFALDLKQEVFMLLLIKPDIEILDLDKRGKLYSYFAKLVYNQMFWDRSQFHIQYNTYEFKEKKGLASDKINHNQYGSYTKSNFLSAEQQEPFILPDTLEFDINDTIEDAMENLSPYHEKLMRLYSELGTYRAVGERTGIAWKSVYNAVTNARAELIKTIKKEL